MIDLNNIYNEDCFKTMDNIKNSGNKVDIILTSPPYNTSKKTMTKKAMDNYDCRYDTFNDFKSADDYIKWTIDLFNAYDSVLNKDKYLLQIIMIKAKQNKSSIKIKKIRMQETKNMNIPDTELVFKEVGEFKEYKKNYLKSINNIDDAFEKMEFNVNEKSKMTLLVTVSSEINGQITEKEFVYKFVADKTTYLVQR